MIRYYEKLMLIPAASRRESGYRDYSDEDVSRLRFIADAREIGFEADEIRSLLSHQDDRRRLRPLGQADAEALEERLRVKVRSLERIRTALLGTYADDDAAGATGDGPPG